MWAYDACGANSFAEACAEASETLGGAPDAYLVCGPEAMIASVVETLQRRGVPSSHIEIERFASPGSLPTDDQPRGDVRPTGGGQLVELRMDETTRSVTTRAGETLLEAGLRGGVDMPFSCTLGGCGACRAALQTDTAGGASESCGGSPGVRRPRCCVAPRPRCLRAPPLAFCSRSAGVSL